MQRKYLTIIYSTVGVYAEFILGFIISIILSRYFSTYEYGIYTFVNSVTMFVVILINSGISLSAIRLVSKYHGDKETTSHTVKKLRKKLNARNSILTLVTVLYFIFFYGGKDIPPKIVLCFMAGSFFKAQYIFLYSVQKGAERFDLIAKGILLLGGLNFFLIVVCVWSRQPLEVFFVIYLIISLSFFLLSSYFTRKYIVIPNLSEGTQNNALNKELSIVKPLAITSLFSFFIMKQSEVFFLKALTTNEMVALFSIPFNLYAALTTLIPGILINVLLPVFSKQKGSNIDSQKSHLMAKSLRFVSYLTIPLSAFVFFNSDLFITYIYSTKYAQSSDVLQIIVFALYFASSIAVFNSYMITVNREKSLMYITITSSIMTLGVDYILIHFYSLNGAAFAYLIGILGMYFIYIIANRKTFIKVLDLFFNIKLVIVSALSIFLISYIRLDNVLIDLSISFLCYLVLIFIFGQLIGLLNMEERLAINKCVKRIL